MGIHGYRDPEPFLDVFLGTICVKSRREEKHMAILPRFFWGNMGSCLFPDIRMWGFNGDVKQQQWNSFNHYMVDNYAGFSLGHPSGWLLFRIFGTISPAGNADISQLAKGLCFARYLRVTLLGNRACQATTLLFLLRNGTRGVGLDDVCLFFAQKFHGRLNMDMIFRNLRSTH